MNPNSERKRTDIALTRLKFVLKTWRQELRLKRFNPASLDLHVDWTRLRATELERAIGDLKASKPHAVLYYTVCWKNLQVEAIDLYRKSLDVLNRV